MFHKLKKLISLIIFIAIPLLAGALGSFYTMASIPTWYATLNKPMLNPPSWVFGPVWTILYIMMGIAAFLIWQKGWKGREVKIALVLFFVQLALNVLWSVIFFGQQNPGLALIEIIILWAAILATILSFKKSSKPAATLLVPYLLWVTFATYLNFAIWRLN